MKTELTKEQSQRLIELGVPSSSASMTSNQIERGEVYYNDYYQEIFTLPDLLEILPKEIEDEEWYGVYKLALTIKYTPHHKYVACYSYDKNGGLWINDESYFHAEELIDALYELCIWVLKNGQIK